MPAFTPTDRQAATLAMVARCGAVNVSAQTKFNVRNHYEKLVRAGALARTEKARDGVVYYRYTAKGA